MNKNRNLKLNLFLSCFTVSLVGNTCADYALVWLGVSALSHTQSLSSIEVLVPYFLAQSIGKVVLAPLLAAKIENRSRRAMGIGLDSVYIIVLLALLGLTTINLLNSYLLFVTTLFTSTASALHSSIIPTTVLKKFAGSGSVPKYVLRFDASRNFVFLIGTGLSGIIFKHFGFSGCLSTGILSFIPMFPIYFLLFKSSEKISTTKHPEQSYIVRLREGYRFLINNESLRTFAVVALAMNSVSVVLPTLIGIAFEKSNAGSLDKASIVIASVVLLNTLLLKLTGEISKRFKVNHLIVSTTVITIIFMSTAAVTLNPLVMTIGFFAFCVGSSIRNLIIGTLRATIIPDPLIARVNTAYISVLGLGQIIGSLLIIPMATQSLKSALLIVLGIMISTAFYSLKYLPSLPFRRLISLAN